MRYADLSEWVDDLGFVSRFRKPGPWSCDNLLLFTATALCLVTEEDALEREPFFYSLIRGCRFDDAGNYLRYPNRIAHGVSHDDLKGLAAWSFLRAKSCSPAKDILAYGRKKHWCWNADDPPKFRAKYYLARFPEFVPFLITAGGEQIGVLDELAWATVCLISAQSPYDDTSGKCLQYLMNRVMLGKGQFVDAAIRKWKRDMASLYKGGMREVYAKYFGADHPFAVLGPADFE